MDFAVMQNGTPSPVTRTPSLCQGPLHVTESALETVTRNEAFPGRSHFRLMPDRGGSKPQPEALRHLSASPPSNDRCEARRLPLHVTGCGRTASPPDDARSPTKWLVWPGRCWPRAVLIGRLRWRQRRKGTGDRRMRLRRCVHELQG